MSEGDGNTLHLDLTKQCGSTDKCECPSPKPKDIQAKKDPKNPTKGFVKRTHDRISKGTFTLPLEFWDKSQFTDGPIHNVKKVETYYGNQRPTKPLLLAITTDSSDTPKYYINNDGYIGDVGRGNWNKVDIFREYGSIQKTLDHFNCKHNKAIPIDLKDPTNLSRFHSNTEQCCLKSIVVSRPETSLHESEYEAKYYRINPPSTHLSRVAYNGNDTDMGVPTNSVTTFKVYTWTKEEGKKENERTPLLVEFKTTNGQFYYHKNTGTSGNLNWESASKEGSTEHDRQGLTKLLKEARCNVFYTFQVELDKNGKYGNNECSERQIDVATYGDNHIENYIAYKHTYDDNGGEFTITEFINGGVTQDIGIDYPIRKVTEVVVYLCNDNPLLVYYKQDVGLDGTSYKWFKKSAGTKWTSAVSDLTTKDGPNQHEKILKVLDEIESECGPPSVVIDISQGLGQPHATYEDPPNAVSKQTINVEKKTEDKDGHDPPQYYDRYDHTVVGRDSYFDIKLFQCGSGNTISQITREEAATSVSVYYWSHGDNTGKPLLVRVAYREKKSQKDESYKWYENTGTGNDNTNWKEAEGSENFSEDNTQLKNKLDLLNCKLNNVVIVDAYKQPKDQYCHEEDPEYDIKILDKSHPPKLQVKEESSSEGNNLATYKAYEHSTGNGKFHIVGFKGDVIGTSGSSGTPNSPLKNVTKVLVYFCKNKLFKPLLIYYEQQTTSSSTTHHWYKKPGNTWEKVPELSSTSPNQHTEILKELDQITSPCQPPKVTIDIKNGPNENKIYTANDTSSPGPKKIQVDSNVVLQASDFLLFTHTVQNNTRGYFTVQSVKYGEHNITTIAGFTIEKVKEFSVYYWDPLKGEGRPLLIRIVKKGATEDEDTKWYENTGTNGNNTEWQDIGDLHNQLAKSDMLAKKLTLLNCKLNNVTTVDITVTPSKGTPYCHDKDSNVGEDPHPPLIKVRDISKTPPYEGKLGKFAVYQHSLSDEATSKPPLNGKFHISDFKNSNINKGTPIGIPTPALNVPKVLVYFCDRDETRGKPLLVHFKHIPSKGEPKQEWYQTTKEGWKSVETEVPDGEEDIPSIYAILNNYATSCKDDTLLRILLGTAAGSAGGGATTYGVYEMIRWLFMSPWPRLM